MRDDGTQRAKEFFCANCFVFVVVVFVVVFSPGDVERDGVRPGVPEHFDAIESVRAESVDARGSEKTETSARKRRRERIVRELHRNE